MKQDCLFCGCSRRKINMEPENTPGKGKSSSKPSYSGSILIFGGVLFLLTGFDCFLWWESKFATIGELWYAFSVYSLDGQVIWDILCWDSSNSYQFCFGANKNTSPACCFASWASKVTKALPPAGGALSWTNHQLKRSSNWIIFPVIPVKIKHLKTATQLWNGPEWWLIIPY